MGANGEVHRAAYRYGKGTLLEGQRRCTRCGLGKPLDCFSLLKGYQGRKERLDSWCRTCRRLASLLYQKSAKGKERLRRYINLPDVKARRKEHAAGPAQRAQHYRRQGTVPYRLRNARRLVLRRLGKAKDPEKRRRLEGLVALYDKELERLKRR